VSEGEVGGGWGWYRVAYLRQLEEYWRIMMLMMGMLLEEESGEEGEVREETRLERRVVEEGEERAE
jgi:hypothetical protein